MKRWKVGLFCFSAEVFEQLLWKRYRGPRVKCATERRGLFLKFYVHHSEMSLKCLIFVRSSVISMIENKSCSPFLPLDMKNGPASGWKRVAKGGERCWFLSPRSDLSKCVRSVQEMKFMSQIEDHPVKLIGRFWRKGSRTLSSVVDGWHGWPLWSPLVLLHVFWAPRMGTYFYCARKRSKTHERDRAEIVWCFFRGFRLSWA